MVKFIATDMDGTLVNHEGEINNKIFDLIEFLNERNVRFAAASGRFYCQLNENFKDVNSNMIFIAHNGALIKYNNDGDMLFDSPISKDDIKRVSKIRADIGEELFLAGEKRAYIINPSQVLVDGFVEYGIPLVVVNSFDEIREPIYKITYFMEDGISDELKGMVDQEIPSNLESVLSGKHWLDIMNSGISKGNAIKILQNEFGFDSQNTMVFGDYYNDLSMFRVAEHSYAMEDAPEDVKSQAKYIAGKNSEDAVYQTINRYVKSIS